MGHSLCPHRRPTCQHSSLHRGNGKDTRPNLGIPLSLDHLILSGRQLISMNHAIYYWPSEQSRTSQGHTTYYTISQIQIRCVEVPAWAPQPRGETLALQISQTYRSMASCLPTTYSVNSYRAPMQDTPASKHVTSAENSEKTKSSRSDRMSENI